MASDDGDLGSLLVLGGAAFLAYILYQRYKNPNWSLFGGTPGLMPFGAGGSAPGGSGGSSTAAPGGGSSASSGPGVTTTAPGPPGPGTVACMDAAGNVYPLNADGTCPPGTTFTITVDVTG